MHGVRLAPETKSGTLTVLMMSECVEQANRLPRGRYSPLTEQVAATLVYLNVEVKVCFDVVGIEFIFDSR
jgi:hypothetical protein